jgi:hypothetical protein
VWQIRLIKMVAQCGVRTLTHPHQRPAPLARPTSTFCRGHAGSCLQIAGFGACQLHRDRKDVVDQQGTAGSHPAGVGAATAFRYISCREHPVAEVFWGRLASSHPPIPDVGSADRVDRGAAPHHATGRLETLGSDAESNTAQAFELPYERAGL